ncbi:PQQ-binding-like beta-propeller repeat protein [Sphaerisporangium melleum]|uniref:outer membrane protein assembly factor BamB family protein n=1 Tax=Sphaerisporangium melleum TaxID=321316 RepID=UPI00166506ED|nr:PQQ-binding-like beta-propeller repeat protein [Sphaerisporangium melleum]
MPGRHAATVLLTVVLVTCPAATADAPRLPFAPVEWRAVWSVPADAGTGEPSFEIPQYAVSDQAVAIATRQGAVQIRDPRTGALRRVIAAGPARTTPITGVWIAPDTLVVSRGAPNAAGQALDAHDLTTGATLWRRTIAVSGYGVGPADAGVYRGSRIMVTERGIVVFERPDEPFAIHALDLRTGATTARAMYQRGCDLRGAATARSVVLLGQCAGNRLRLASMDPRTLRPGWTRPLSSFSAPPGGDPAIRVTADAAGYVHASVGDDDFFYRADGHLLSTDPPAVAAMNPGRWSPPLFAASFSAAAGRREALPRDEWPLPAYLISLDSATGRLGGLPLATPSHRTSLIGTTRDMAFVHSDVPGDGRITAYKLIYGLSGGPARFGGVPASAWPDACALLTGRDLRVLADGYRAAPGADHPAGTTLPEPVKCDWIPPEDDGAVVSLTVEWASSSSAGARRLFTDEVGAIKESNAVDLTTESPGFLSYTVATTNGFYGATIINVGPVIVRLRSPSRQAIRRISPLLRDNLLARYQPGVRAAVPARADAWSHPTDAVVHAEPVVADGAVYATSGDGTVSALDAATGAVRWRFQTGGSLLFGHVVAAGTVFAANTSGRLVALDAATGRLRWSRRIDVQSDLVVAAGRLYVWTRKPPWSMRAEIVALNGASGRRLWAFRPRGDVLNPDPVPAGDAVHLGGDHGMVYALDSATGARKWRFQAGGERDHTYLVRAGGVVYAASTDGEVYALDAASGKVRWRSGIDGFVGFRPVLAHGTLYLGDKAGTTYALDAGSGTPLWSFRKAEGENPGYTWAAAVARALTYFGGADGRLYALDAVTGRARWSFPLGKGRTSGPVVTDRTVLVGDSEGTLHALDATTGTARWSYRTGGTVETRPVAAGGLVYVGSSNGNVYALPVAGDRD